MTDEIEVAEKQYCWRKECRGELVYIGLDLWEHPSFACTSCGEIYVFENPSKQDRLNNVAITETKEEIDVNES